MDALDTPDHDAVLAAISTVMDPEAGMNVVDLGLIYGVDVADDRVAVTMTMTTPTCPVGDYLRDAVRDAVLDRFPSIPVVDVELTFDPPWTPDKMSDAARAKFGGESLLVSGGCPDRAPGPASAAACARAVRLPAAR
jgi:metal-sulfur cluster biosynthetic enzyme